MFTILHIPHSSKHIPANLRNSFLLSDEDLAKELLYMTDHFTDKLFDFKNLNAEKIVFPVSRLVVDPERFIDDIYEPMARKGMGAIYIKTAHQRLLRKEPSTAERNRLIDKYYEPHHKKLHQATASALEKYRHCLIMDCHSFPSKPLPFEDDQSPNRPDICIGADQYHTPEWLVEAAVSLFNEYGFKTEINKPFAGALVPIKYYKKSKAVKSVMIEVNRSLYMNEETGIASSSFQPFKIELEAILGCIETLAFKNNC